MYSDKETYQLIQSGKGRQVLEALYQEFYPKLEIYIVSRGGEVEDAKDIFQESVLVFYKKVIQEEISYESCPASAFIFGVAKNKWFNKLKRDQMASRHHENIYHEGNEAHDEALDFLSNEKRKEVLQLVLSSVGEKCKAIFSRVIFTKLTMEDIAEELGYTSANSLKVVHHRCRKKLMEKLKGKESYVKSILRD